MPFCDTERFIYEDTALIEVVCQLRFPPILRIEAEIPAKFQDRIRHVFPNYSMEKLVQQNLLQIRGVGNPLSSIAESNMHHFESSDGNALVLLTNTFITLKYQNGYYKRWEDFARQLRVVIDAFQTEYSPSFYTRVGLEYTNVFTSEGIEKTGCSKKSDLINTKFLSSCDSILSEDEIIGFTNTCTVSLGNQCVARITTDSVYAEENPADTGIRLDYDMYKPNQTAIDDVEKVTTFLHDSSTKILRSVITEQLHDYMRPIKI